MGQIRAKVPDRPQDGFVLDKLGQRLQARHAGHVDGAAHRGGVLRVVQHVAHEAPVDPQATRGEYAQVLLDVGQARPASVPAASTLVHLSFTVLVDAKGAPKPAWDLYKRINAAGVPRQAEVIVFTDDVAEAALGYYILRLMGWLDVKVWLHD